jgi:hypothetical protein
MKSSITITALLVLLLGTSSAFAQTNVSSVRSRACTINDGYTMADVVETARAFEWSDETSPRLVAFRSKVAVSRPANRSIEFDFIADFVYPSYADMVDKRGASLRRQAESDGRRALDGVATCSDNVLMRSARNAAQLPGGPGSQEQLTAVTTVSCELNGATVADAVAAATGFGENLGSASAVLSPAFGGQQRPIGSSVQMIFFFQSFSDFGASRDRLEQNLRTRDPQNPISCSVPSLWASYRIHRDN